MKTATKDEPGLFGAQAPEQKAEPAQVLVAKRAATKAVAAKPAPKARPSAPARVIPILDPAELLDRIASLAENKNVDADKLDKLLALQERLLDRNAKIAFQQAMIEMQPKLPLFERDGSIVVRAKDSKGERTGKVTQNTPYAKWETIAPLLKPILAEHGFSLRHRTETAPDGKVRVVAMLEGYGIVEESYMDFEVDVTGSKNNAQGRHSAVSYGRRITGCAMLNLITRGEDDNGAASGKTVIVGDALSPEEVEKLIEACAAVGCPKEPFLKHMNETRPKGHPEAAEIEHIPASRLQEAMDALARYDANRRERDKNKAQPKGSAT